MCIVPKLHLTRSAITVMIARTSVYKTNDAICSVVYPLAYVSIDLCLLRIIAFPASYMKIFF
jgi:hypothetical protein